MINLLKDKRVLIIAGSNLLSNIGINLTFLAIPWYLADTYGDDGKILGLALIVGSVIQFFINPIFGSLVDTKSRKNLILLQNLLGFIFIGLSTLYIVLTNETNIILIVSIYIFNSLLRSFHYNNLTALNQEIFNDNEYTDISSITEVEGQISVVLSGLIGAYLITYQPMFFVLTLDALSFILAFIFLCFLPYKQTYKKEFEKPSYFRDIKEGVNYSKKNIRQITLLLSLNLPFMLRGLTLLIIPYYISSHLGSEGNIYGYSQMIYGAGAILSGIIISSILKRFNTLKLLILLLLILALTLIILTFTNSAVTTILIHFLMGISISSLRISRNAIMMKYVDKYIIGRVNGLLSSILTVMNLALIGIVGLLIASFGPQYGYGFLFCIILISITGISYGLKGRENMMNYNKDASKSL